MNEATAQTDPTPAEAFLKVSFDIGRGGVHFEWFGSPPPSRATAEGWLVPSVPSLFGWRILDWCADREDAQSVDFCGAAPASVRALLKRIQQNSPLSTDRIRIEVRVEPDIRPLLENQLGAFAVPAGDDPRRWLARVLTDFAQALLELPRDQFATPQSRGRAALVDLIGRGRSKKRAVGTSRLYRLRVTFNVVRAQTEFTWTEDEGSSPCATGVVTCSGPQELRWELTLPGEREVTRSSHVRASILGSLIQWSERFPVAVGGFEGEWIELRPGNSKPVRSAEPFEPDESPWPWVLDNLVFMAQALTVKDSDLAAAVERHTQRFLRREERQAEARQRQAETIRRKTEERRRREREAATTRRPVPAMEKPPAVSSPASERPPLPPVPVNLEMPPLVFQATAFPLTDLRGYFLRERAARWWVSNQSDDLLALPHCRIERLEYQIRSALRVLGPMRGRALLSDEVGLGKTIEAGLVLKELLTRGLAKRFLILTVPSLVDQWEEELKEKFGLATVTTNQAPARQNPETFWRDNAGIVASLHTLKQPAHLQIAATVNWDLLVVDEAHYLRNRESQAWQAVNALPRQFLLLLTATPVQNSLDDLYHLITLLQPGQLPSPKEFRARFVDPKRPRQPREPEELRRLLGQVMIRNTRANAGVNLPPRRAETVVFAPTDEEQSFWKIWEAELRAELTRLPAAQGTLWGRLLLQAAGSSPAAWRDALEKFPNRELATTWQANAPLEASWRKKCELLPPLTRGEGGLVVFTQFRETQAALAQSLREARVETFVINGATPPPQRQPLTEEFRRRGGALLLTHSGTEGRNLQFCHRLVNFDLPWNPMEIEQRIGRLHRLGQQHPVRIYNLVQAGTLQEHLLEILQEKLNLFELVVGETGLILGERFSSDEFAEEVWRRWRESEGRVAEAFQSLGEELTAARQGYEEIRKLDDTLFARDYESA